MIADFSAADPRTATPWQFLLVVSRPRLISLCLAVSSLGITWSVVENPVLAHTTDDYEVLNRVEYHGPFATDESETYTEVWAANGYAYLGSVGSGVAIIDTSNQSSLSTAEVFGASTGDAFYDVRVEGSVGYFSTDTSGTYVVDLSTPTSPGTLTTISSMDGGFDSVTNAYIDNGFLYQVSETSAEIVVFDISTPATPSFVTKINTGDTVGIYDLIISDDRLYAAGLGGTTGNGAAYIYDVSDSYSLIAEIATGENTASVAPNTDNTSLVVTHREVGGTIAGWDITTPTSATLMEEIDVSDVGLSAYSAGSVSVLGDLAYVAWNQAGVQVIDLEILEQTGTIYRVGAFGTSTANPLDGFVGNQSVFVADHGEVYLSDSRWGLFLVDATNVADFSLGDFNGDEAIDADDLQTWLTNSGLTNLADADADGDSDGNDFLLWQANYSPASEFSAETASIPEPQSLALTILALVNASLIRKHSLPRS